VPTMQLTQEDLGELQAGTLPCQAVWKFSRDNQQILDSNASTSRVPDVYFVRARGSRPHQHSGVGRALCLAEPAVS